MTDLEPDVDTAPRRRRPSWALVVTGVLLALILLLALLWIQRREVATRFIDRELIARGVAARYRVTAIGPRTQRLEDVVIGDPARPDLTARLVEVETVIGFGGAQVKLIRARGVRLNGRIVDGRLRLGEVDKLLPAPTGAPFELPDIAIDVDDAAMRLDTPAGRVGLALQGRGNLASGFAGQLSAGAARLAFGECRVEQAAAVVKLATFERRPSVQGPLRASALACPGLDLARPQALLDATLSPALDSWRGGARLALPRLAASGATLLNLTGPVGFEGDMRLTRGDMNVAATDAQRGEVRAARLELAAHYAVAPTTGAFSMRGDVAAQRLALGPELAARAAAPLAAAAGTPLAPIGDSLAEAVRLAARSLDGRATIAVTSAAGGAVRVEGLSAASRSGAVLSIAAGAGFTYYAGTGAARFDGTVALTGGGFPQAQFVLSQARAGAPMSGTGTVAPIAAGNARLRLAPIRFAAAADGVTRLQTTLLLSGPIGDGYVDGLLLPISGRFSDRGFAIGERCTPVRFASLRLAGLVLDPTQLPLCPTGPALIHASARGISGGARIASPRLTGRLGASPVDLSAAGIEFSVGRGDFAADRLAVRVQTADAAHRLDIARLSGAVGGSGIDGRFAGAAAQLANVPLLIGDGTGTWRLAGGSLSLTGSMTIADSIDPARFYPLASRDFRLTLAGDAIDAIGSLTDPETGTRVGDVTIAHALSSGRGRAVIDVPGITFGPDYQPEQLTRLTTGVIALVDGTVKGRGEIVWSPEGTTSSGTFGTEKMNLAASFGPVEGLTTTVHFTDLLGLVTAPGQVATTDLIRTGIDVFDGTIRYQLLPNLNVRVESGRWPYSGGELILEETLLDFSRPSDKNFTFRVVGLDAARFIAAMEFDNIAATGLFDGTVPMIFDAAGGRIVGGHLVARPEGGTLSYIGELTDRDLGVYGKLAFDALKSLSYEKFTIDLDGSLDGEFLTRVELDGIARDMTAGPPAGSGIQAMLVRRVLGEVARIPFEFNINIRGPFRALLATARSFEDPSMLIQSALPPELRDQPISTVQPQESEPVQ